MVHVDRSVDGGPSREERVGEALNGCALVADLAVAVISALPFRVAGPCPRGQDKGLRGPLLHRRRLPVISEEHGVVSARGPVGSILPRS